MEAAELRNGLYLATNGTDKGTFRHSLLHCRQPGIHASASRKDPYRRQPFGDSRLLPGVLLGNFTLSLIVVMH